MAIIAGIDRVCAKVHLVKGLGVIRHCCEIQGPVDHLLLTVRDQQKLALGEGLVVLWCGSVGLLNTLIQSYKLLLAIPKRLLTSSTG